MASLNSTAVLNYKEEFLKNQGDIRTLARVVSGLAEGLGDPGTGFFHSFAGLDITAGILFPATAADIHADKGLERVAFRVLAEIQTISVSSQRGIAAVRRLGESSPAGFSRGARTIAGTMVCALIRQDVLRSIYQRNPNTPTDDSIFFVDQIPPFHIVLTANNEYGQSARMVIYGVTLMNTGMTLSVDDLFIEQTFTYVAKGVLPFVVTAGSRDFSSIRKLVEDTRGGAQKLSDTLNKRLSFKPIRLP